MKKGKSEWIGEISRGINSLSGLWTLQLPQTERGLDGVGGWEGAPPNADSKLAVCTPGDVCVHLCVRGLGQRKGNLSTGSPRDPQKQPS